MWAEAEIVSEGERRRARIRAAAELVATMRELSARIGGSKPHDWAICMPRSAPLTVITCRMHVRGSSVIGFISGLKSIHN